MVLWYRGTNAPVTGRLQAISTTPEAEAALGEAALAQLVAAGMTPLPASHGTVRRVRRLGEKLTHALAALGEEMNSRTSEWLVRPPSCNDRISSPTCIVS